MRSAYAVLGVPGNATDDEIREAYERAAGFYTPEKLAAVEGAADKFAELKAAYGVLREPAARAAHDRKLSMQRAPKQPPAKVEVIVEEESPVRRLLLWGMVLVAALFAAGMFMQWRAAEARREQAQAEILARQQAQKEAEARRAEQARLAEERAAAKAKQEQDDRRFAMEGEYAAARATAERARQEANALNARRMAQAEAERAAMTLRLEEQRAATEARMRIEADKRRIRELCWQQYQRVDC